MGHHPHDAYSGVVGLPYVRDGKVYILYESLEDVAPDHACFPDWQLRTSERLYHDQNVDAYEVKEL